MLSLDLIPMNNGRELQDALKWDKPIRGERRMEFTYRHKITLVNNLFLIRSPEEQPDIRLMASHTFRLTLSSHHGDSSPVSTEIRPVHFHVQRSTVIRLGFGDNEANILQTGNSL